MIRRKDCFECKDCKDECRCPVGPDDEACAMFTPKKKVRLSIEREIYHRLFSMDTGESITFHGKELIVLLDLIYEDLAKEKQKEMRNKVKKGDNNNGNRS